MHSSSSRLAIYLLLILVFVVGAVLGSVVALSYWGDPTADNGRAATEGDRPENLRTLEQLRSLPYLTGVSPAAGSDRGVVVHERDRVWDGLNFFNCANRAGAFLVNMEGDKVLEWAAPDAGEAWQHAELLPSGDLLVLVNDARVMRVGRSGELRWEYRGLVHHDLWVTDDDRIHLLARRVVQVDALHPQLPVFADEIHILNKDGTFVGMVSILEAVLRSPYASLLPSSHDLEPPEDHKNLILDMLHANHVQVFDGALENLSPLYRRGNVLVSMRTINAIGILDPAERRFLWIWGPTNIARQHHPTLLPNGHILLFDNGQSASQVIEVDPLRNVVVWRWAPAEGFFSEMRGSVQRLANGNTLVTESDPGVVHEVTPDGEVVWRYLCPLTTADGFREPIWRMTRYRRDQLPFLDPTP